MQAHSPEVIITVSIRHQLQRHNAGHQNQNESRNHRHFLVIVDGVNRVHKLDYKSTEVQDEDEGLVQILQPLSLATSLCRTDDLPCAGLGRLQWNHQLKAIY